MRRYLFNRDPKEAGLPKAMTLLFMRTVRKAAW